MCARRQLVTGGASFFWLVGKAGSILFCGRALFFQPRTHISSLPAAIAPQQKTLGKTFVGLQKSVKRYPMNLKDFAQLRYGKQIFRRGHGGTSNRSRRAVFLLKNSRPLGSCAKSATTTDSAQKPRVSTFSDKHTNKTSRHKPSLIIRCKSLPAEALRFLLECSCKQFAAILRA